MACGGRDFPVRGATFPCVRTPSNPHIAYSHCPVSCALAPRAPLLSIDSSIAAALCPREILSFHHDSCVMTSATRMMSASVTAPASSHVPRYPHWVPSSCAAQSSSPMASWWSRSPSQSLSCEWLATGIRHRAVCVPFSLFSQVFYDFVPYLKTHGFVLPKKDTSIAIGTCPRQTVVRDVAAAPHLCQASLAALAARRPVSSPRTHRPQPRHRQAPRKPRYVGPRFP